MDMYWQQINLQDYWTSLSNLQYNGMGFDMQLEFESAYDNPSKYDCMHLSVWRLPEREAPQTTVRRNPLL